MKFKYPFKNRKDVKKACAILNKAKTIYNKFSIVHCENNIIIYPLSYDLPLLKKIYGTHVRLYGPNLESYCKFLLNQKKLISFEKYLKILKPRELTVTWSIENIIQEYSNFRFNHPDR